MKKISLTLLILLFFWRLTYCPPLQLFKISQLIQSACTAYDYPQAKAFALFYSESSLTNQNTWSKVNKAYMHGTGQLYIKTARGYPLYYSGSESDLDNPEISIPLCVRFIKHLEKQYDGDFEKAIAHYSGYKKSPLREKHFKRIEKYVKIFEKGGF